MRDLVVYRREGKYISDDAESLETEEVCYVTSERNKGDYLIVLTTLEREYITYAKNVDSFVALIMQKDMFIKIDRSTVINLSYDFDYNKDLGQLIYKNISYKDNASVIVARKYEKSLEAELRNIGKWSNT